jgi:hypothetical protein
MPIATILWLGLLVVLGILFTITLRRMSALIARTRDLERFQRGVESLDRRFAASVRPVVQGLDETRRHSGDPDTLRDQVTASGVMLAELLAEARALAVPITLGPEAAVMIGELERAGRATELVEHGLATLDGRSRGRDLEAQTSLKRGALNLRHAHEAFSRVAREVARLRPPDLLARQASGPSGAALATYPGADPDDVEGRFDPRA